MVERRLEGLKVPGRQPKKGRLWLNDGSRVRLRPERPNHVWSYDFVEDRTHDGGKLRMLNVIDEFTRERLTIRVYRKLKSTDVIDVLSDLFSLRGVPGHIRSDNGPEFIAKAVREWIAAAGAKTAFIEPGSPLGEWPLRELHLEAPRRAAERGAVPRSRRGAGRHRELAPALQYTAPALEPRLQAARAGRHIVAGCPALNHGHQADQALDLIQATKSGQARPAPFQRAPRAKPVPRNVRR
jgi:transposase InsO family protein